MIVRILPAALVDLDEAYEFYEQQNSEIGDYFLASIESDIESLSYEAGIHPVVYDFYHVKYTRRFPYAIFYYLLENIVYVDAVLDCRRDPEWISERLN